MLAEISFRAIARYGRPVITWRIFRTAPDRGALMALNDLGEQIFERPVTMPVLKIARLDEVAERRELAERFAQQRIIRAGREAWEAIGKAETFDGWKAI